jgi:hypothetical protein
MSAIVSACGGGGGGSSSGGAEVPTLTGVLYDSHVSGIYYSVSDDDGNIKFSGQTNEAGEFNYKPKDTITFMIGNKVIGKAFARKKLKVQQILAEGQYPPYPDDDEEDDLDLIPDEPADENDNNEDIDDTQYYTDDQIQIATINMVRLLMSLDSDGNPDNGIQIDERAHQAYTNTPESLLPDLMTNFIEFGQNTRVLNLLSAAQGVSEPVVTSALDARKHYGATLIEVFESPDTDDDGVPDQIDEAINNPDLFSDIDNDGVHDELDKWPEDPNEAYDTDGDGVGDNADFFPTDYHEQYDSDNDGFGDNIDPAPYDSAIAIDSDGDGYFDKGMRPGLVNLEWDRYPENPREWADSDLDGCLEPDPEDETAEEPSNNFENIELSNPSDDFPPPREPYKPYIPECGNNGLLLKCIDLDPEDGEPCKPGDGYGDNSDVFPTDPTDHQDSDGDGIGDNAEAPGFENNPDNDEDGIIPPYDAFPEDPTEFSDADGDGTGDFSDAYPLDPNRNRDSDRDGISNDWELAHGFSTTAINPADDLDNDGFANIFEFLYDSDPNDKYSRPQIPTEFNIAKTNGVYFVPVDSSDVNQFQQFIETTIFYEEAEPAALGSFNALTIKQNQSDSSLRSQLLLSNGLFAYSLSAINPSNFQTNTFWFDTYTTNRTLDLASNYIGLTTGNSNQTFINLFNDPDSQSSLYLDLSIGTGLVTSSGILNDQTGVMLPTMQPQSPESHAIFQQHKDRALIINKDTNTFQSLNLDEKSLVDLEYPLPTDTSYVIAAVTNGTTDVVAYANRDNENNTVPTEIYIELFTSDSGQKNTRPDVASTIIIPNGENQDGSFDIASDYCVFSEMYASYLYLVCDGVENTEQPENSKPGKLIGVDLRNMVAVSIFDLSIVDSPFITVTEADYVSTQNLNDTPTEISEKLIHIYNGKAIQTIYNSAPETINSLSNRSLTPEVSSSVKDLVQKPSMGVFAAAAEANYQKGLVITPQHIFVPFEVENDIVILNRKNLSFVGTLGTFGTLIPTPEGNLLVVNTNATDLGDGSFRNEIQISGFNLNGDIDNDGIPDVDEQTHALDYLDSLDAVEDADNDTISNIKEIVDSSYEECPNIAVRDPNDAEDCDGDGMTDHWEDQYGLDKFNAADAALNLDGDEPPLTNLEEFQHGLNPSQIDDSDSDQIPDHWELYYGFDIKDGLDAHEDPDGDGVSNQQEFSSGTNPVAVPLDSDNDQIPNDWETYYGLNPNDDSDARLDPDLDGFNNLTEYTEGMDPLVALDSDGDTMPDYWETLYGLNPQDSNDQYEDPDGDRRSNYLEYRHGGDPTVFADEDGDQMSDYWEELFDQHDGDLAPEADADNDHATNLEEFLASTNPTSYSDFNNNQISDDWEIVHGFITPEIDPDGDADSDGLTNKQEYDLITDPNNSDTDSDGINDSEELAINTNPQKQDTDSDGLNDGDEINASTDPLDSDSDNDGMPDGWEVDNDLNPLNDADANLDRNNDGETNLEEYLASLAA